MNNFYARVKIGKSNGKARVVLIRKILVSAYCMLKKKKKYYWVDKTSYNNKKMKEYQVSLKKKIA